MTNQVLDAGKSKIEAKRELLSTGSVSGVNSAVDPIQAGKDKIQAERDRQAGLITNNNQAVLDEGKRKIQEERDRQAGITNTSSSSSSEQVDPFKSERESYQKTIDQQNGAINTYATTAQEQKKILGEQQRSFADLAKSTQESNKNSTDSIKSLIDSFNKQNGTDLGYSNASLNQNLTNLDQQRKDGLITDEQYNQRVNSELGTVKTLPISVPKTQIVSDLFTNTGMMDMVKSNANSADSMLNMMAKNQIYTSNQDYADTQDILIKYADTFTNQYNSSKDEVALIKDYNLNILEDKTIKALAENEVTDTQLDAQKEAFEADKKARMNFILDKNSRLEATLAVSMTLAGIPAGSSGYLQMLSYQTTQSLLNLQDYEKQLNAPIVETNALIAKNNLAHQQLQVDYANGVQKIGIDAFSQNNSLNKEYQNNLMGLSKEQLLSKQQKSERQSQVIRDLITNKLSVQSNAQKSVLDLYQTQQTRADKLKQDNINNMLGIAEKFGQAMIYNPETKTFDPVVGADGKPLTTVSQNKINVDVSRAFDDGYAYNDNGERIEGMKGIVWDKVQGTAQDAYGNTYTYTTNGKQAQIGQGNQGQTVLDEGMTATDITDYYGNKVQLKESVALSLEGAKQNLSKQGINLSITDSYRSPEAQQAAFESGKPGVVSAADSFHTKGQAFDLNQNDAKMKDPKVWAELEAQGFQQNPKEWWHWSKGEFGKTEGSVILSVPKEARTAVTGKASQFDSEVGVKNFQTLQEAKKMIDSISNQTKNPVDDQALIYAFAKAMDPNSVVRESEYATAKEYAQDTLTRIGFDIKRIYDNKGFVTPEARANIKKSVNSKYMASEQSYDQTRNQYVKILNSMAGKDVGNKILQDYKFAKSAPKAADKTTSPSAGTLNYKNAQNQIFKDLQAAEKNGTFEQEKNKIYQELMQDGLNPDDFTLDIAP